VAAFSIEIKGRRVPPHLSRTVSECLSSIGALPITTARGDAQTQPTAPGCTQRHKLAVVDSLADSIGFEPMVAFDAMSANDQKYLSSSLIADSASALCRTLKVGVQDREPVVTEKSIRADVSGESR
jgi:hypothetical protein